MPCFDFIKNILQQQKINCCYIPRKRCRITEETLSNHRGNVVESPRKRCQITQESLVI